jgi:hypothetical protein
MDKNNLIVNAAKIGTKPPVAPAWFTFWVEHQYKPDIKDIKADVTSLKKDVTTIKTRLDNIVKLNNLKE